MLKKRIIICLDVKDGRTTKGVKFLDNVDIGDPVIMADAYYAQGVDELVFYDIMASAHDRGPTLDLVANVAKTIHIPFCVGGGISTVEDIRATIKAGAEKVSLNSPAVRNPALIREGAAIFGNQCIVLGMDAKRDPAMPSGYRVYINGGRVATELDALEWALRAEELGAGEIVLNSIDADGTRDGYEITVTSLISSRVSIPVIASGGAGKPEHLAEVLTTGKADAALIASMVHSGEYTVSSIKDSLAGQGIPVRR
ncbi:MAG TPA: imidazole glycerol phosphate synthase subunit HisF [Treponemataceae bacterium]|jgi:cyclase|nr:imidazole glycerol phosphate synthase subunit HisF [Treponema sp.]HOS34516.1 imidazole glycerol phosphate synthase subunit HisF [Treponemataceae bacterium]HPL91093.1 imidazole glycerol phosphate synthase subunit HisF [Treponemataceae bacterium]HPX13748.1 imidazole glycerol phosphate synthase subunit HisF [Treponemataceae bacterium]